MNAEEVDFTLIVAVIESLIRQKQEEGAPLEHILVFLPGWKQISGLSAFLEERRLVKKNYDVLLLHSMLPLEEQRVVFTPPRRPRIILSTNIAETSVTIPYINVVIDSGLQNTMEFNAFSNADVLSTTRITQSNVLQRRGRTGRLHEGLCIHLYSFADYRDMPQFIAGAVRGSEA